MNCVNGVTSDVMVLIVLSALGNHLPKRCEPVVNLSLIWWNGLKDPIMV